jgi:hypothetical protein
MLSLQDWACPALVNMVLDESPRLSIADALINFDLPWKTLLWYAICLPILPLR